MTFPSKPFSSTENGGGVGPGRPTSPPDFEDNLSQFQTEFFDFVAQTDPSFDLKLLYANPAPLVEMPPKNDLGEVWHPTTKEELNLPLRLTGPKVVSGDIVSDQVLLEGEVRVKGNVYGRSEVKIGPSCVVEGSVVSGGGVEIGTGSRIEGAVIGGEVRLSGPLYIEGPVYSRASLVSQGRLEAQILYASDSIRLGGDPTHDTVRIEAGLVMARAGELVVEVPLVLAEVEVRLDKQKFYVSRSDNGELVMERAYGKSTPGQSTVVTSLTDADLEKLVADLAGMES